MLLSSWPEATYPLFCKSSKLEAFHSEPCRENMPRDTSARRKAWPDHAWRKGLSPVNWRRKLVSRVLESRGSFE